MAYSGINRREGKRRKKVRELKCERGNRASLKPLRMARPDRPPSSGGRKGRENSSAEERE